LSLDWSSFSCEPISFISMLLSRFAKGGFKTQSVTRTRRIDLVYSCIEVLNVKVGVKKSKILLLCHNNIRF
jgi:hypothetical protein